MATDRLAAIYTRLMQTLEVSDPAEFERRAAESEIALHDLTPGTGPPWLRAFFLCELGRSLAQRPGGDKSENIERAIVALEEAAPVLAELGMAPQWAHATHNLATAYSNRLRGDPEENSERATALFESALRYLRPDQQPLEWAMTMRNLAQQYASRKRGDKTENVELALDYLQRARAVVTPDFNLGEWAACCNSLSTAYLERLRGDRQDNIRHAVELPSEVLRVLDPRSYPELYGRALTRLADAYGEYPEQTEEYARISDLYERALKVLDNPASVDEWAHAVTSYGHHVLRPLFAYDEERLERVIGLLEQTRVVHPRDKAPEKWANHTADLAVAYSLRRKGDHVVNGERAIVLLLQALEVQTRDANPEKWAQHLSNLAVQYFERQVSDRQDNLRRAIEAGQQALEMQSAEREPIPRANTLANLGAVYAEYEEGDRAENIERAIGYFEEVERLFSETGLSGRPHAILLFELGKTKFERLRGDRADNIEQAIGYLERAAVAASAEAASDVRVGARDLVAEAYTERLRGQPSDNRARAEMHRREALKICSPQFLPVECRKVASRLGGMYSDDQRWSEAVATYRLAIDASEAAYEKSILGRTRDIERSQAMTLYADAAYAMARAGMLREAVVTLERARGRELADALALAADLEGIRAKDRQRYERLQEVLRRLNGLEAMDRRLRVTNSGAIAAPDDDGLRAELQAALNRIRELPGYETFLLSPEWPAVRALLAGLDRSPLVFVLAARCGGLALVVRTSTGAGNGGDPAIDAVWSTLRTSDLLRLLVGNRQPEDGGWLGGYSRRRVDPLGWLSTVENVSRMTWDLLMAPLAEDLRRTHDSEVVLVPCGMLALLPLHAAWTEMPDSAARHYFLDEFACRYAPSIRAQAETHKVAQRSPANKLLAVDEPRPVTTAGPLPNSATEVRAVASHFKEVVLLAHEEATRSRVLEALATADVAHFACHGKNDVGEPLRSGILLSNDEHLTVGDILDMHLHSARLVTLSACETGVIGVNAPDEVVGLPAALVQAGCAGVVSSLWSVSDVSTAMLMERFYRLWRMDGMSPALALREAQRWLRDSTNQEKADGYREDGPTPAGSPPAMSSSAQAFVTDGRSRAPAARTFEHPFWWAAFYLTGE